jgi:hypothetical protein
MFIYLTPIPDLQNVSVWAEEDDVEVEFAIADAIDSNCRTLVNLNRCIGEIKIFIEHMPIPSLQTMRVRSIDAEEVEFAIVDAIASNYRTIVNFDLKLCCASSTNHIVECCLKVERLTFTSAPDDLSNLKGSDIEALASLPRLKRLEIRGSADIDLIYSLSLLKGLRHLGMRWSEDLEDVLLVIGRNAVSLEVMGETAGAWQGVLDCHQIPEDFLAKLNGGLKKRLKRLASLKVNRASISLGTDLEGY